MKRYLLILTLLAMSLQGFAQSAQIYTKKARLEDFSSKTTKVIMTGDQTLDLALQDAVSSYWRLSAFEFCSPSEYKSIKNSNDNYYIHLSKQGRIAFLTLAKGGKENEKDHLKTGFEVISIPFAPEDGITTSDLSYLPAYINIIQNFTQKSISMEGVAYGGLGQYNISNLNGYEVTLDKALGTQLMASAEPNTIVGLLIAPLDPQEGEFCYKILIACDTHKVFYFRKSKIDAKHPADWLKSDLQRIYGNSAR